MQNRKQEGLQGMTRNRLPNRRESVLVDFTHDGLSFTIGASFYIDGGFAEAFISAHKTSSAAESVAMMLP
jgi:hypothetical protein